LKRVKRRVSNDPKKGPKGSFRTLFDHLSLRVFSECVTLRRKKGHFEYKAEKGVKKEVKKVKKGSKRRSKRRSKSGHFGPKIQIDSIGA
jgi:hypothetical protein